MNPRLADPSLTDLRAKLAAALESACLDCDQAPVEVPGSEVHPWVGPSNAIAPPMRFHLEGDMLVGLVECSSIYGEGRVHGGVIAGLFDAIVATRGAFSGTQMTAKLDIDYRRPVPLNRTLRMEAGVDRVEGRKHHLSARMFDGDTVLAEAHALTLLPKAE
jgi:acyl-coenzyme A thioesterase PaaI-like protein